ncbi:hypothetical protein MAR_025775 [Mya arenaria]|uniref:Uncharacterized protein n=1 Tax=Mya arenaria TaxID=6604 RepID=A0ABY7EP15_MYAAR|nr:hypothetical protein MAR_025775 [Mya arenaria]
MTSRWNRGEDTNSRIWVGEAFLMAGANRGVGENRGLCESENDCLTREESGMVIIALYYMS